MTRISLIVSAAALALTGCVGGTTYGTGVSQEEQLVEDVTSLLALGGGREKKERIRYDARPGLLPPPADATLPPPAQAARSGQDGYFPVDPETQRARRRRGGDDPTTKVDESTAQADPEVLASIQRDDTAEYDRHNRITDRNYGNHFVEGKLSQDDRKEILKRRAETKAITGAGARRYLTEPKATYRTPADTAAAGEVGERINPKDTAPKTHADFERGTPPT